METIKIKFHKEDEYLTTVFEREAYAYNSIPTNCILDKTLPGLGATYSEILAKRNSIIIEPNIPVILGKTNNGKDKQLLAVYEKQTDKTIEKYLNNARIRFKKILCTPESFMRVRRIAASSGINIYVDYFCLFDECEKITQDIDFRENIALPMNDFFSFTNKAFVSATPLDLRNPNFAEHGFFKLKVDPQFDYKKDIDLIVTNRYDKTVIDKLEELRDSECVCIFLNSTNGINKIVTHLESKRINDYKTFCSDKSVIKFKDREISNSFENLDLPLAKYNFFTCRFFSAVDIKIDKRPDILILTDLNEAKYSRIDPVTNAIQIYGRFRNVFEDGKSFNSLTHITNVDESENVLAEPDIETYLEESELQYDTIKNKLESETNTGRAELLKTDLRKITFNRFINEDGSKNYFAIDNFYDDERVKGYYLTAESIESAYCKTNHFNVNPDQKIEIVGDRELLHYKRLRSDLKSREYIVKILASLDESDVESDIIEVVKNQFRKHEVREKAEVAKYIIDAYEKLGAEALKQTEFKKNRIDSLLNQHNKEFNHRKMFSQPVRETIKNRLSENTEYPFEDVVKVFEEIFTANGVEAKYNLATIRKFFGADKLKGQKDGWIKLWKFQPDKEL